MRSNVVSIVTLPRWWEVFKNNFICFLYRYCYGAVSLVTVWWCRMCVCVCACVWIWQKPSWAVVVREGLTDCLLWVEWWQMNIEEVGRKLVCVGCNQCSSQVSVSLVSFRSGWVLDLQQRKHTPLSNMCPVHFAFSIFPPSQLLAFSSTLHFSSPRCFCYFPRFCATHKFKVGIIEQCRLGKRLDEAVDGGIVSI